MSRGGLALLLVRLMGQQSTKVSIIPSFSRKVPNATRLLLPIQLRNLGLKVISALGINMVFSAKSSLHDNNKKRKKNLTLLFLNCMQIKIIFFRGLTSR
jgi:hypothetical protein